MVEKGACPRLPHVLGLPRFSGFLKLLIWFIIKPDGARCLVTTHGRRGPEGAVAA
jgi:hypothetical protein